MNPTKNDYNWRMLGEQGLRCFGSISASISHEIRNAVAIMHENAGLMQDLFAAAEKGRPLDPDRLKRLGDGILQQVRRAELITRNMNAFAHSVDDPEKSIQLEEHLKLAAALFARTAASKKISLEVDVKDSSLTTVTNPFFLLSLLWFCLLYAMEHIQVSGTIALSAERGRDGVEVRLQGLDAAAVSGGQDVFPSPREQAFAQALDGRVELSRDNGSISIQLPRRQAAGG